MSHGQQVAEAVQQAFGDENAVRPAPDDALERGTGVLGPLGGTSSGAVVEGDYEGTAIAPTEKTSQTYPVPMHLVVFFLSISRCPVRAAPRVSAPAGSLRSLSSSASRRGRS
jgi:hypothetical protein